FHDTAPTALYTLSLHDALPIWAARSSLAERNPQPRRPSSRSTSPKTSTNGSPNSVGGITRRNRSESQPAAENSSIVWASAAQKRSEEHTSELQSRSDLVCRLLL